MTEIEHIVEGSNVVLPNYSGRTFTEAEIERGAHRAFVSGSGGSWDEDSLAQLTFLRRHGLMPQDRLIDIGCGALRAGRHFVDYLDAGNYYGVDANLDLVTIGMTANSLTPSGRSCRRRTCVPTTASTSSSATLASPWRSRSRCSPTCR